MKNNLLKYMLVLSLLLNFSLLGAAGYRYYRQSRYRPVHFGYGPAGHPADLQPYIFEALALKPDQRKQFEQKAELFHAALDKKRLQVDRLRKSLFELMRTDNPDRKAIAAGIVEINGIQESMQKLVVAHLLEFKSMLDKEQQKKCFDLIQQAINGGQGAGCPEALQR